MVKQDTHVNIEWTSLCSVGLPNWVSRDGSASSLSTSAKFSGKRSRISTNSNWCIRLTSLAGIGGKLLARLNGRSACAGPRGLGAVSPGGSGGEPPPSAPEEVSSTWQISEPMSMARWPVGLME